MKKQTNCFVYTAHAARNLYPSDVKKPYKLLFFVNNPLKFIICITSVLLVCVPQRLICDATYQGQGLLFLLNHDFCVIRLLNKRVFSFHLTIHVSGPYKLKVMCISKCYCS